LYCGWSSNSVVFRAAWAWASQGTQYLARAHAPPVCVIWIMHHGSIEWTCYLGGGTGWGLSEWGEEAYDLFFHSFSMEAV
jgi:hypothetical protein